MKNSAQCSDDPLASFIYLFGLKVAIKDTLQIGALLHIFKAKISFSMFLWAKKRRCLSTCVHHPSAHKCLREGSGCLAPTQGAQGSRTVAGLAGDGCSRLCSKHRSLTVSGFAKGHMYLGGVVDKIMALQRCPGTNPHKWRLC